MPCGSISGPSATSIPSKSSSPIVFGRPASSRRRKSGFTLFIPITPSSRRLTSDSATISKLPLTTTPIVWFGPCGIFTVPRSRPTMTFSPMKYSMDSSNGLPLCFTPRIVSFSGFLPIAPARPATGKAAIGFLGFISFSFFSAALAFLSCFDASSTSTESRTVGFLRMLERARPVRYAVSRSEHSI